MQSAILGLRALWKHSSGRKVFFGMVILFIFAVFAVQNGSSAMDVLSFGTLPFLIKLTLFSHVFFDITSFTAFSLILGILGSVIGAANTALLYVYVKTRGEVIVRSGLYSGVGLVFAVLGIGCAACGTVLIGSILGFLGLGSVFTVLPYHGEEIGALGILVLVAVTYSLAKKVAVPTVC
jgi:hypothetical protein